jgi:RNA polymerase sigma factor (sigma-70 family)
MNPDALPALQNDVLRYVRNFVTGDVAADLAQDVFVYLLEHASDFEPDLGLQSYVYSVASNHAFNHLRKAKAEAKRLKRYARVA